MAKAKSSTKHVSLIRKAIETHEMKWTGSRDYLKRTTELPHFNQLYIAQILQMTWKSDPLDENSEYLDKELNICVLLPPPHICRDQQCLKMRSAGLNTNLDDAIDQHAKFSEKKSTKLFIHGRRAHSRT